LLRKHWSTARCKYSACTARSIPKSSAALIRAPMSIQLCCRTWGPQGPCVRGVKTMVKTVGGRRIALLESYGKR
jgi:hypothetical protein